MIELLCIIAIIALLISSQVAISNTYKHYSKESSNLEYTGKEIAEKMLQLNGVNNVSFGSTERTLNDYYNSKSKTIYFSKECLKGNSIASIAVAAHETGHALQDASNYSMLKIRKFLAPISLVCSKVVWIIILIGVVAGAFNLILIGFGLIAVAFLFQLITLPVEFDASRRAVEYLNTLGYGEEVMCGVKKMLKAAAYTYVASFMASILQSVRLFVRLKDD